MDGKELQNIIIAYKNWRNVNDDTLLQDCADAININSAIEMAATARGRNGKRHRHQVRINGMHLKHFSDQILTQASVLENAASFDEIYEIVKEGAPTGIADLTIYDTAHRIGVFLNIHPDKVFLHTGTRQGTRNLLGRTTGPFITMNQLPRELQGSGLSPAEIEDFLCHCKDQLSYYQ